MHCIFHIVEQNPLVEIDTTFCLHDEDMEVYGFAHEKSVIFNERRFRLLKLIVSRVLL